MSVLKIVITTATVIALLGGAIFVLRPKARDVPLAVVQPVNPAYFIAENLVKPIQKELRRLPDGTETLCYVITLKAVPSEHKAGPWAPRHVTDGKDKGGIWIKDGHAYDVDGEFVAHIGELYKDREWNLVREDGSIKVTDTREAFELAARPNVDPRYHNHVVAVPPEVDDWKGTIKVYVIPVNPVYRSQSTRLGHAPVGLAFNGVNFEAPAPLHAIIAAHTIAPFDDAGGHVNMHVGYHYHAATGHSKEIAQADGHAPMIGYALDGFGMYAHLDKNGKKSDDLDECRGHYDAVRGYHYHVCAPGENQIIGGHRGRVGTVEIIKGE
ncbi:MAG: YHYH protein [Planctomycetota bacterium]|nr:YHYH protein [Planctomycetota bacterium]